MLNSTVNEFFFPFQTNKQVLVLFLTIEQMFDPTAIGNEDVKRKSMDEYVVQLKNEMSS